MMFTNVMKTLMLIALFVAGPMAIYSLSRRHITRLVESLKTVFHRS